MDNKHHVYILLGGGLDSTGLINFYLSRKMNVTGIHFDYGQPSLEGERRSVKSIGEHYNIKILNIDLGYHINEKQNEYMCRNAMFLLSAASLIPFDNSIISIGIHAGTQYYDCTQKFIYDIQRVIDGYFSGTVQVDAPFINLTKNEIYFLCIENNVPIDLTFSCNYQSEEPCGVCFKCREMEALHEHRRYLSKKEHF